MKKLLGLVLILMLVLTTGVFAEEDGIRIGLVWQNITSEMGSDMQAGAMYMANELGLEEDVPVRRWRIFFGEPDQCD